MNKQTKRLLILLISVLSLFGLFGCRANPTENGKDESDSTVHDYREGYTNDTNNLDVTPQEKGKEPEEPSTVRLLLCWDASSGTVTQEGLDRVADALAKQAEPLGLILEVLWAEEKDVLSRLSAALESGETLDLCYLPAGFFQSRDQGLLLPIARNDLQENAPAFNARMGRTAAATSAGNMVYGFPAFIRRGAVKLMSFRADLCEAAGYSRQDIYSMTAWSEIEALMRKAQAVAGDAFVGMAVTEPPTTVGLGLVGKGSICAADRFAEATTYEDLGDPLNLLGVTRDEFRPLRRRKI